MFICIVLWQVVRSSADGRPTVVRLSVDGRPMIDRCKTEEFPRVHIFNVKARRRPIKESQTV